MKQNNEEIRQHLWRNIAFKNCFYLCVRKVCAPNLKFIYNNNYTNTPQANKKKRKEKASLIKTTMYMKNTEVEKTK